MADCVWGRGLAPRNWWELGLMSSRQSARDFMSGRTILLRGSHHATTSGNTGALNRGIIQIGANLGNDHILCASPLLATSFGLTSLCAVRSDLTPWATRILFNDGRSAVSWCRYLDGGSTRLSGGGMGVRGLLLLHRNPAILVFAPQLR